MSDQKLNEAKPKLKALLFHDDLEFVKQGLQLVESLSVSEKSFSAERKRTELRRNWIS